MQEKSDNALVQNGSSAAPGRPQIAGKDQPALSPVEALQIQKTTDAVPYNQIKGTQTRHDAPVEIEGEAQISGLFGEEEEDENNVFANIHPGAAAGSIGGGILAGVLLFGSDGSDAAGSVQATGGDPTPTQEPTATPDPTPQTFTPLPGAGGGVGAGGQTPTAAPTPAPSEGTPGGNGQGAIPGLDGLTLPGGFGGDQTEQTAISNGGFSYGFGDTGVTETSGLRAGEFKFDPSNLADSEITVLDPEITLVPYGATKDDALVHIGDINLLAGVSLNSMNEFGGEVFTDVTSGDQAALAKYVQVSPDQVQADPTSLSLSIKDILINLGPAFSLLDTDVNLSASGTANFLNGVATFFTSNPQPADFFPAGGFTGPDGNNYSLPQGFGAAPGVPGAPGGLPELPGGGGAPDFPDGLPVDVTLTPDPPFAAVYNLTGNGPFELVFAGLFTNSNTDFEFTTLGLGAADRQVATSLSSFSTDTSNQPNGVVQNQLSATQIVGPGSAFGYLGYFQPNQGNDQVLFGGGLSLNNSPLNEGSFDSGQIYGNVSPDSQSGSLGISRLSSNTTDGSSSDDTLFTSASLAAQRFSVNYSAFTRDGDGNTIENTNTQILLVDGQNQRVVIADQALDGNAPDRLDGLYIEPSQDSGDPRGGDYRTDGPSLPIHDGPGFAPGRIEIGTREEIADSNGGTATQETVLLGANFENGIYTGAYTPDGAGGSNGVDAGTPDPNGHYEFQTGIPGHGAAYFMGERVTQLDALDAPMGGGGIPANPLTDVLDQNGDGELTPADLPVPVPGGDQGPITVLSSDEISLTPGDYEIVIVEDLLVGQVDPGNFEATAFDPSVYLLESGDGYVVSIDDVFIAEGLSLSTVPNVPTDVASGVPAVLTSLPNVVIDTVSGLPEGEVQVSNVSADLGALVNVENLSASLSGETVDSAATGLPNAVMAIAAGDTGLTVDNAQVVGQPVPLDGGGGGVPPNPLVDALDQNGDGELTPADLPVPIPGGGGGLPQEFQPLIDGFNEVVNQIGGGADLLAQGLNELSGGLNQFFDVLTAVTDEFGRGADEFYQAADRFQDGLYSFLDAAQQPDEQVLVEAINSLGREFDAFTASIRDGFEAGSREFAAQAADGLTVGVTTLAEGSRQGLEEINNRQAEFFAAVDDGLDQVLPQGSPDLTTVVDASEEVTEAIQQASIEIENALVGGSEEFAAGMRQGADLFFGSLPEVGAFETLASELNSNILQPFGDGLGQADDFGAALDSVTTPIYEAVDVAPQFAPVFEAITEQTSSLGSDSGGSTNLSPEGLEQVVSGIEQNLASGGGLEEAINTFGDFQSVDFTGTPIGTIQEQVDGLTAQLTDV